MSKKSTTCLNGKLVAGDLVISVPGNAYPCLVGSVLEIDFLGTLAHQTENETDDVHVNFTILEYSEQRKQEIADAFSTLYQEKKQFDECPMDDTIMAPDMLIRITDLDECIIKKLLSFRKYAEKYYHDLRLLENHSLHNKPVLQKNLPDGRTLVADIWDEPEYPGIRISLKTPGQQDELLCFAEHSSTKPAGKELCIAVYAQGQDEPVYYESYCDPQAPSPNN